MTDQEFKEQIRKFEGYMIEAVKAGSPLCRTTKIPAKDNALLSQPFGILMGRNIESDMPFCIDYYGYIKLSHGLERIIQEAVAKDPPPRSIQVSCFHFASLHIEDVVAIAPDFVQQFVPMKTHMLRARGFKK